MIIRDRESLIDLLKKQSVKMKSKVLLFLLVFLICFLAGGIYFIQSLLNELPIKIGEEFAWAITAISKGIVTNFFLAIVLGIIIGYLLSIITFRYNKYDLLIDSCNRIEKLENEINNLKRHNKNIESDW
jgi:uncharacterized protein YneF (UPF0154 family)